MSARGRRRLADARRTLKALESDLELISFDLERPAAAALIAQAIAQLKLARGSVDGALRHGLDAPLTTMAWGGDGFLLERRA